MQWSTSHAAWLFVATAGVLLALLWLARHFASAPSARRFLLLVLRACVFGLLLFILGNPVQVSEAKLPARVPGVIQLVDVSRSMGLDSPQSRLAQVQQTLNLSLQLTQAGQNKVRLSTFRFGKESEPLTGPLQPRDDATRLLEALEDLPARFGEDLPKGVIVFSDGRSTDEIASNTWNELAAGFKALGVPLHVFPVGNPNVSGDVAIRDVIAPRSVPPGVKVPVKVVVGSVGCAGERAEILIRSTGFEPTILARLPITLTDTDKTYDLTVESDRATESLVPLIVEVPARPTEAFVQNNQVALKLLSRNPKLRVIYMEGTLGNEYRWIRDALVEDPNIECLVLEVNAQYAQTPTLHRVTDPSRGYPTTREELFSYDVVLCSDINRVSFTPEQLQWTHELVSQRGGGFAMIGGNTSFGAGNWDQTIWDGMIPVDMSGRQQGYGTIWNVNFQFQVPAETESHPVWRIVDDPRKNHEILQRIPPFYGTNRTDRVKPAATVLANSSVPLDGSGIIPVLTCQSFGKGRSVAFSPDSTVDWGRDFERLWGEAGDNRYFRKFWRNVVRWLGENSAGANRQLRLETDKLLYRPGEPIVLTALAFDEQQIATNKYRLVARLQAPALPNAVQGAWLGNEEPLSPDPQNQSYSTRLESPAFEQVPANAAATSGHRMANIVVTAFDGDRQVAQTSVDFQILDDSPEYRDPRPDLALLTDLANTSGGQVLHTPQELANLLNSFPVVPGESAVFKTPLWDRAWVWLLLFGLLAAEWIVRRAWGLG